LIGFAKRRPRIVSTVEAAEEAVAAGLAAAGPDEDEPRLSESSANSKVKYHSSRIASLTIIFLGSLHSNECGLQHSFAYSVVAMGVRS
jgi:hypothetical protein